MCVFWKYEEEGEICSRGSEERCELYGISSSFNLLYLVLIPVVSGRGPETKETVCERQTDIVRWTPLERLWVMRFCVQSGRRPLVPPLQFSGTPRTGSSGNCRRSRHETGVVMRGRKSLKLRRVTRLQQTQSQQGPEQKGWDKRTPCGYSN